MAMLNNQMVINVADDFEKCFACLSPPDMDMYDKRKYDEMIIFP